MDNPEKKESFNIYAFFERLICPAAVTGGERLRQQINEARRELHAGSPVIKT